MKTFTIITLIICSLPITDIISQNDTINQVDKEGRRFGYWRHYYENGKIKQEGEYQTFETPMSPEELFMLGITKTDSLKFQYAKNNDWLYFDENGRLITKEKWRKGVRLVKEEFQYNTSGKLSKTIVDDRKILFGSNKDIIITQDNYKINSQVDKIVFKKLSLRKLQNGALNIDFKSSSDRIRLSKSDIKLKSGNWIEIPFSVAPDLGNNPDYIEICFQNPDSNRITIPVISCGYHLSIEDFSYADTNLKKYELTSDKLFFYRTLDECELKIYSFNNKNDFDKIKKYEIKELKVIPLSLEFNEINISFLSKGAYLFRVVNYTDNIDLFAIIYRI